MDIIIYSRERCQGCRAAKRMMDKKGATYNEVHIDSDEATEVRESGMTSLPIIQLKENGALIRQTSGFHPDDLQDMINQQSAA